MQYLRPARFFYLFLVVPVFLALGCQGGLPHDTPETLARSVFKTLQQNDIGAIRPFLPTVADLKETYDAVSSKMPEGERPEWDEAKTKAAVTEIQLKMDELWKEVHGAGEKEGIVWAEAKENGVDILSNAYTDKAHTDVAEAKLTFSSGGSIYYLLVGAANYRRGWLLARLSLGK